MLFHIGFVFCLEIEVTSLIFDFNIQIVLQLMKMSTFLSFKKKEMNLKLL